MASYAEIRKWASVNDIPVASTGRIAAEVIEAYEAAHTTKLDQAGAEPVELQPTELDSPRPSGESGSEVAPSGPSATGSAETPASPPLATRRTRPRLPDVLFLPGRGRVRVNKDRPGSAGEVSPREKD